MEVVHFPMLNAHSTLWEMVREKVACTFVQFTFPQEMVPYLMVNNTVSFEEKDIYIYINILHIIREKLN